MVFGHSRGEHPIDRGLQDEFCAFLDRAGLGYYWSCGVAKWQSSQFVVRPYYWGDCTCDEGASCSCECSLPNFEHPDSGFKLQWYKYPLRDSYSNKPLTGEMIAEWVALVEKEALEFSAGEGGE